MEKKYTYQHWGIEKRRQKLPSPQQNLTDIKIQIQRDQEKKWTVNRSPHGNKTAREQFGFKRWKVMVTEIDRSQPKSKAVEVTKVKKDHGIFNDHVTDITQMSQGIDRIHLEKGNVHLKREENPFKTTHFLPSNQRTCIEKAHNVYKEKKKTIKRGM